jgi:hypothetical protein
MSTLPQNSLDKMAVFADLHYEPHPGQKEIHDSTAPRRIVACGVRWGKTTCAAMEGLAAALEPRERSIGWIVAPTYDLADRVYREIQLAAVQHIRHRVIAIKESERRLILRNLAGGTSEIRAKSADNPVSLLGEGLDWVVIDEASRLKPIIWQSHLSQRLIDKQGWALLISTPKGKGYFYDLFQRGKQGDPDYASWNMPSASNPLLDKDIIEQERDRLPDRVFRQEYEAQFLEGAGAVFSNVRECATGEWAAPEPNKNYWAGLDLARIEDYTVLTIMDRHRRVVFVDRFHKLDWDTQVARIKGHVRRFNNARLWVDVTGKGDPIKEALQKAGLYVFPYPFTLKSKTDLINALVLAIEQRLITLPKPQLWPEGIDELEAFQYSITDQGNVRMAAPGSGHDDCVISLALALWDLRPSKPEQTMRVYPLSVLL